MNLPPPICSISYWQLGSVVSLSPYHIWFSRRLIIPWAAFRPPDIPARIAILRPVPSNVNVSGPFTGSMGLNRGNTVKAVLFIHAKPAAKIVSFNSRPLSDSGEAAFR